jgi:hypothetical protein
MLIIPTLWYIFCSNLCQIVTVGMEGIETL